MSSLKQRRWRRKGLDTNAESPSWRKLTFVVKVYDLRLMLLVGLAGGLVSFAMLYQLEAYGYWEAKGAKVEGVVGHGIAYFFVAIFIGIVILIIKDWRRN